MTIGPPRRAGEAAHLRWGVHAPSTVASARERLIDATALCLERFGVAKTTVEDVAAAAQVSRATVYRYFDGRDALILGVLERDAKQFMERLVSRIRDQQDVGVAIVESVVFTVSSVRADPHLALLFAPDAVGATFSIPGTTGLIFRLTSEALRPTLERARDADILREGLNIDEAAEWILRTTLSLLSVPTQRTETEDRRLLMTYLVPALVKTPQSLRD